MSSKITQLNENEKEFLLELIEFIQKGLDKEGAENPEQIMKKFLVETGFSYDPNKWQEEAKSLENKKLAQLDEIDVGGSHKTISINQKKESQDFGGSNIHKMIKIDEDLYEELIE